MFFSGKRAALGAGFGLVAGAAIWSLSQTVSAALTAGVIASTAAVSEPFLAELRRRRASQGVGKGRIQPISDLEEFLPGSTGAPVQLERAGYEFGDTTVQDITILVLAAQAIDAKRVFEIGTFRGRTSMNLARNLSDDAQIYTLDLSDEEARAMGLTGRLLEGSDMTDVINPEAPSCVLDDTSLDPSLRQKITLLRGNSMTFDFSPYRKSIDFVFIDGGHTYEAVDSDTRNALAMVRPGD